MMTNNNPIAGTAVPINGCVGVIVETNNNSTAFPWQPLGAAHQNSSLPQPKSSETLQGLIALAEVLTARGIPTTVEDAVQIGLDLSARNVTIYQSAP